MCTSIISTHTYLRDRPFHAAYCDRLVSAASMTPNDRLWENALAPAVAVMPIKPASKRGQHQLPTVMKCLRRGDDRADCGTMIHPPFFRHVPHLNNQLPYLARAMTQRAWPLRWQSPQHLRVAALPPHLCFLYPSESEGALITRPLHNPQCPVALPATVAVYHRHSLLTTHSVVCVCTPLVRENHQTLVGGSLQ